MSARGALRHALVDPEKLDAMKELQEAFDELTAFVGRYDPISLLSQLTLTFLFVPTDAFQGEASDVFIWQQRIEFLGGFLFVRPYPSGRTAMVDGIVLERLEKLLERYFTAVDRYMVFESVRTSETTEKDMVLAQARIHSLHVRGDAYPHQFYAFAKELYGPHDTWFREHLGFTIAEAVELSIAIGRECEKRFNRSIAQARIEAHRRADELVANDQAAEADRPDLERRIGCALHFGQAERLLAITPEELSRTANVASEVTECFLRRMSQEFGYKNPSFPRSFTDPFASPWDYNTLNERPILTREGKYWLFVGPMLRSALFHTFYFDLRNDSAYWPNFERARGTYLEEKTASCLQRVFPPKATLLNPLYLNGEEMADVIVLHDHKILIFQCKSKALTYRARIGADFDALRDDVRKAIADSFQQGIRAQDYLKANERAEFTVGNAKFSLDMNQVNGIHVVCVTSMPFQMLAARLANTNPVLGLFQKEYPWSLSLGDLDVITEVLSSPAQFVHYVRQRQAVEETPFRIDADEMDFLGFYLSHGMRFDMDEFKGMDNVALSGFSDDVDRWIYEKFELGRDVDAPRSAMPNGFADFLRDVERTGDDYSTDCALALLDLSWAGRQRFMELVVQTKERSRQDKALHSFSTVLKDGKRGFSYVVLDGRADQLGVYKQAAAFAMLKKYQSKCDEWIGLGSDIGSSGLVDSAFYVLQTWAYDEPMECLANEKLRPGQCVEP